MGKLIDADKLKRKCQKVATEAWKMKIKASIETTLNQFIDWIDQAEPVDAVPVVRCRECKYAHMTYDGECKYCDIWFPDEAEYIDGDYYCASGERKDGEHDRG